LRVRHHFFVLFVFFLFEFFECTHGFFPEDGFRKGVAFLGSEGEAGVFEDILFLEVLATANDWNDNMIDQ